MYYSNFLHKKLQQHFGLDLIGKKISYPQIRKKLNKILKEDGILIKVYEDNESFSFSGFYDPDLEELPITIFIHVDKNQKYIEFDKENYSKFIFEFSQIVQHEMIHYSQFLSHPDEYEKLVLVKHSTKLSRKRKKKINYLREASEIEAYAHDIAMEINYYYPDLNIQDVFKNLDNLEKLNSYHFYRETFQNTKWRKVRKMLLQKTWRWIPVAKVPNYFKEGC